MRTARSNSRPGGGSPPGTSWDQTPLEAGTPRDQAPPCGQTHTCKHITLPQT